MRDYTIYNDNELLVFITEDKAIRDGAFKEIYARYSERLYTYCKFRVHDIQDAEEIYQETWIKFHQVSTLGAPIETIAAYLFKIARNLSISLYRSQASKNTIQLDEIKYQRIADEFNLEENVSQKDLLKIVKKALETLDEQHKESFILRWFNDLTYVEIADISNETPSCIKMRCHRAMDKMLTVLKPYILEVKKIK